MDILYLALLENYFTMNEEINPNEFKCYHCGGIYVKGWTDEEAIEEQKRMFNVAAKEDDVLLCDDCYRRIILKVLN